MLSPGYKGRHKDDSPDRFQCIGVQIGRDINNFFTLAAEDPKQRSFGGSAEHSLDWGPTVWGPTFSVHEIWSWGSTQWTGGLQSWGRESGDLQSWVTGF